MNTTDTLSQAEIAAIRSMTAHYPEPSAAAIDALLLVQAGHGWISDAALEAIAERLNMSPAELDGVATFYNLIYRHPIGANVIHYCDSVSCWLMGADAVRSHLSERLGIGLGETTADGRYTLLPIVCLGACDHAPALLLAGELHGDMDAATLDRLLDDHG